MTFLEEIRDKIGEDCFQKLVKIAEIQVSKAMSMPLIDEYRQKSYYRQSFALNDLLPEFDKFLEQGLTISPVDVLNILSRCKLFKAVSSEDEYDQRNGGGAFPNEYSFQIPWESKAVGVDILINNYFERLKGQQKERVLITKLSHFDASATSLTGRTTQTLQEFFTDLFKEMEIKLHPFFEDDALVELHKVYEPGRTSYSLADAMYYFQAPSLAHTSYGSIMFCHYLSSAQLRTILNMLRIASFSHSPQIDFGQSQVELNAPAGSVFLGTKTWGGFSWDEDTKEPWSKIPDGCLHLSFGYRGLSKMWLDNRAHGALRDFFIKNSLVVKTMQKPWGRQSLNDIVPTLDILSSVTQIPDTGAKILQLYCCLEHLFVPSNVTRDNKKYIVGGINAINPELLPWFEKLYILRCQFAHKGFIIRNDETRFLIFESVRNLMSLLTSKLNTQNN